MSIILASQSPRRRELMALITNSFSSCTATADERPLPFEEPIALVQRLAEQKALCVTAKSNIIIGCDTVVDLDGKTLCKPQDKQDAIKTLSLLSAREHLVHTGVCILYGCEKQVFASTTRVTFAHIPMHEINAYACTKEPYDKAGAYGIQGWAAKFVEKIDGCYFNVMGFPVSAIYARLMQMGIEL